jgi:hypothetical protein
MEDNGVIVDEDITDVVCFLRVFVFEDLGV